MTPGDMLRTVAAARLRADPLTGGDEGKYPAGSLFVLLVDDPEWHHLKVLAPDGKTGWLFRTHVEVICEAR